MKQTKRRLLSLLMAFAILCTMIPAAFAAEGDWTDWTGGNNPDCTHQSVTTTKTEATCTEAGEEKETCTTCGATRTKEIAKTEHTWGTDWKYDDTHHWHECTVCHEKKDEADHNVTSWTWSKDTHTGT